MIIGNIWSQTSGKILGRAVLKCLAVRGGRTLKAGDAAGSGGDSTRGVNTRRSGDELGDLVGGENSIELN